MQIERDIEVPMRDGLALSTDVYRPAGDRRHPAIIMRTPYDKRNNALYLHAATIDLVGMVEAGYAVVVQDCRGRFASPGEWEPFVHEADDGFDAIEWIAAQEWSDGHVGIYGNSYMSNSALQAAIADPPHLDAVYAYMGGSPDAGGWSHEAGAFELSFMFFWLTRGAWVTLGRKGLGPLTDDPKGLVAELARASGLPKKVIGHLPVNEMPGFNRELIPFIDEWLRSPDIVKKWADSSVTAQAHKIRVPVLHISGVFDNFARGHVQLADKLGAHADPAVRDEHRFVFGPWDHEAYMTPRPTGVGEADYGPLAANGYRLNSGLTRRWFDRWLKGDTSVELPAPGVTYWEPGRRDWAHSSAWPPPHDVIRWYLASDSDARTSNGDGTLGRQPADGADADWYSYDPLDPTPTVGGRTLAPVLDVPGVVDQREVELRPDVLVYSTPVLADVVRVRGEAIAHLYVSSDCEDTDFTAKLVDVHEDGYAENVGEGIVRVRHRNGFDREEFLAPGEVVEVAISMWDVAHDFGPGHVLRLEISSANFPRFDRNLNSRVAPAFGRAEDARVARQRVHHDDARRSHLALPVVAAAGDPAPVRP